MEINNVFSPVPFYASKRYWHSNKWYTYGQKCPIIMTAEKTLPFQLVVSPGVTLSSFTIKKADNDASVMTVNTAGNYFSIDAEAYSIIQVKVCTIGPLPYGNYYYALTLSDGSTYISDIIAVISDMSKCIKITYKNVENLYFSSGHIDFTNDFVFELYLPTTIGKPEYEYEEELTKRLGYKFVESQVVNKVYKFTFPATEQLCDAYRFVRMCDYIRIDTYNPDFSDYDHYNVIYLSSEVEWLDNGDIASVETSFETDSIVQKLQDYSRTQLVNFYNALLSNSDEVLKFDEATIAQYYNNYLQSIDGKMIRQLDEASSISDNTVIAIDENNGAAAAKKILLKPLLVNTVAEQLRASEVLTNFQQHINNSSIHITVAEKAILSLFGVDDNGDVYVKGDKGFYTNSFVSAKGKSSSAGSGGSASALYQLVDVLANSTNDGVQGATTNSVLMYNGTKWYAGTIEAGLDEAALKAYLDANKYTTTTYVDSQISTINSQLDTKADKTALSTYLPLSGGTITGDLTVNDIIYVGATNYVYHTGNLAGDNAWITLASNTISHKTIHANNITLIASSGQFVTGYTVDKAGHVTSISQRALNASDIPNIAITQVTGLQDALDKKVDTAFFARVFGLLDADGNEIAVNDVATVADSIKAKFGLWTEQYISAKGKNSSAGGGGSVSALYQLVDVLANSTNDGVLNATNGSVLMYNGTKWYAGTIDTGLDEAALKAYLDANKYTTTTYVDSKLDTKADKTALNAYATLTYVNDELAGTNSTVSALVEKVNNFLEGTDTDGIINKWKELEAFLAGQTQTSTLADLLNVKAFASTKIIAGTGLTGGGDLTADRTLSLATSGVTAGTYPKVTVDKYGRATAGSSLSASDIPNLSWNKITSDKPTTLSGYGITDGVNSVTVSGSGNAVTAASVSGHVLTLTKGATYLLKSTFDDLFEKVLLEDGKTYAIRAKYGFYSDSFVSSKGLNSSSSGGGGASALYQLVDVLANSTNDGVLNAADGSVLMYNGTKWQAGNVVTDISPLTLKVNGSSLFTYDGKSSITANLAVPTKVSQLTNDSGYLTAITKTQVEGVLTGNITSHTHDFASLTSKPTTIEEYGITDAIQFTDGPNYVAARFTTQAIANKAASTYIEWWQNGAGFFSHKAAKYIVSGGTSSQFLKGDGSLDSTAYLPLSGGTITGDLSLNQYLHINAWSGYGSGSADVWYDGRTQALRWVNVSDMDFGGNIVLHSGNYNSHAPSLTGAGASGTWGINITGKAATATKLQTARTISLTGSVIGSVSFDGSGDVSLATTTNHTHTFAAITDRPTTVVGYGITDAMRALGVTSADLNTIKTNGTYYISSSATNSPSTYSEMLCMYNDDTMAQLVISYDKTGYMYYRGGSNSKGYYSWRTVLDSDNYNSYSPTLTGTGASGTWGINISGNAATSNYSYYLRGRRTNGTYYDSVATNNIIAEWNTKSDNRWYLKAAATYECRVDYATNADKLDGRHLISNFKSASDINEQYIMWIANGDVSDIPKMGYSALLYVGSDLSRGWQIWNSREDPQIYWRPAKQDMSGWANIHVLVDNYNISAYNAGSATKLQTARTIWGQSFDGTGNVSGSLTGVTDVIADGVIYSNKYGSSGNSSVAAFVFNKSTNYFGIGPSSGNIASVGFGLTADTNGTWKKELMTITNDGNVGIGTTSPSYKLDVNGSIRTSFGEFGHILINKGYGNYAGAYTIETRTAGAMLYINYYHNGGLNLCQGGGNVGIGTTSPSVKLHVIGDIAATGAVTAKASSSDIRLKTDITDYKALSIIRSHKSIKYHWNEAAKANADIFNDDYWHYGLIAQDVQKDMPQMVSDVFKDYLVINYERLIPICWKGLQEVDDEVTKLKKKVRKLEMEIRELKQKEDKLCR